MISAFTALMAVATLRREKPRVIQRDWPVNLAHRGASARAPENTLEAFRLALQSGAGGLEMDAHMTRDGRLVVIHDDTVDRTTDGFGAVREMTLGEIRSLDAGYRFSPDDGLTHPYRGLGLMVPTLEEVYQSFPETPINVEIKEDQAGVEEAVLRVIEEAAAEDRTIVAAAIHEVVDRFRRVSEGRVPTAASRREIGWFFAFARLYLESLLRPAYAALQVPTEHRRIPLATPRFLAAAHNRNVRVDVWTINDPDEMRRLLDLGADTIMTDRPEELTKVLEERRSNLNAE
ncbi:MAG TPA: glycerophosphodiester phosphodiesterase [Rubrobacteraceae bacterium]|nr:glycerophosphodiester phosphodiesterase [Rubrobacteraceae bacterium]